MDFYGDLMDFYGDLRGFNGDLMGTTLKKMMHNRVKLSQFDQLFILGKPWVFPTFWVSNIQGTIYMIWYDICQVLLPWCLFLLCKCHCLCLSTLDDLLCSSNSLHMYKKYFRALEAIRNILRLWGHRERARNHMCVALPITKVITGYRWPLTLPPTGLSKDGDLINILVMSSNHPVWICMVWLEDNILYLKPPTHQLGCQM